MAPRVTFGLRGGPELKRALDRLEKGLADDLIVRATRAGAEVLAEAWRERVPVDDGNYRAAIKANARPGKRGATGLVSIVGTGGAPREERPAFYAPRLEFGSSVRGFRAQPSLRPAFDASQGKMLDAMSDELRKLIEAAT